MFPHILVRVNEGVGVKTAFGDGDAERLLYFIFFHMYVDAYFSTLCTYVSFVFQLEFPTTLHTGLAPAALVSACAPVIKHKVSVWLHP